MSEMIFFYEVIQANGDIFPFRIEIEMEILRKNREFCAE